MKLLCDTGEQFLTETECVGFSASPETLRAIAQFLNEAASELEEYGNDFGHRHFMDESDSWEDGMPDIQVFNQDI